MPNTVALNQQDVSVRIRVLDDSDGTPYTGMTAATTGHEIWYQRGYDNAAVTDGGSAADHAAIGDTHTDWEFIHINEGWYRVDIPDAAFLEGEGTVAIGMNATGYTGITETIVIDPILKFQGQASSVTTTTTTFPAGTTPLKGDTIMVVDGTGEPGNQVLITSVSGEVATHAEFETGISATTTTILLIAGDAVTGDGGILCDAATSTLATPAQVKSQADDALSDYDVAVQDTMEGFFQLALRSDAGIATDRSTELLLINGDEGSGAGTFDNTTESLQDIGDDVADLSTRIPASLSSNGNIPADVQEVNEVVVLGTGISNDLWRGS